MMKETSGGNPKKLPVPLLSLKRLQGGALVGLGVLSRVGHLHLDLLLQEVLLLVEHLLGLSQLLDGLPCNNLSCRGIDQINVKYPVK